MSSAGGSHSYRPEIDGLRALAVLAVIINHFDAKLLPSGYLGVDIFFAISGYVITATLLKRHEADTNLGEFLIDFYSRRIKRLLPALLLCVLVGGMLTLALSPTPKPSVRTGVAALFGFANIELFASGLDYFSPETETNAFLHTWSLGVEEQFYLLFPALLWWALRRAPRVPARTTALIGLALVSAVAFAAVYPRNTQAAYYLLPFRVWELGAGCLTATMLNTHAHLAARIPTTIVAVALVALLFVPLTLAVAATFAAVLLGCLLIAGLGPGTIAFKVFTRPAIVATGLISYSLYLWHWPILLLPTLLPGDAPGWLPLAQAVLILAAATASYRYVEQPLRYATWSAKPLLTIAYGSAAATAGCAGMLAAIAYAPTAPRANAAHLQASWFIDHATGRYLETCHMQKAFRADIADTCFTAAKPGQASLYLIGDSHARNYLPALREAFGDLAISYVTMGSGCAYLPADMARKAADVACPDYVSYMDKALADRLRSGDVVVVGQKLYRAPERQSAHYIDFITAFAARMANFGVRVVLLDGTYPPDSAPEVCVGTSERRRGCFSDAATVAQAYSGFDALAGDAHNKAANLFYAPLRLGLCEGQRCGQTLHGAAIWHDRGHITEAAARALAPLLKRHLEVAGFDGGPKRQ